MKHNKKEAVFIPLKDKLVIYFLLIYLVSGGIVVTYLYISSKNALLERTFEQLTSVKFVKKKQLEKYFSDREREINIIIKNIKNLNGIQISEYLKNQVFPSSIFSGYAIDYLIPENKMQFNYNFPEYQYQEQQSHFGHFSDKFKFSLFEIPQKGSYTIFYSIKSDDCIIAIKLSSVEIESIMLENNPNEGLGKTGESYLVGNDKLLRTSSRFTPNSVMKIIVNTESVIKAFQNESNTMITKDYRGKDVLSSFAMLKIDNLKWALIAEIDTEEALSPITEIRRKILFITIFISFGIFIVTYLIADMITKPLIKLTRSANMLSEGKFDLGSKKISNDEIGKLTSAFDLMTKKIQQRDIELKEERLKRFSIFTEAQEQEKQRISKELHDGVGQNFSALKLKMEAIENSNPEFDAILSQIKCDLDSTIDEIRNISNNLMPVALKEFGIGTALRNLCNRLSSDTSLKIEYDSNFDGKVDNDLIKINVFRVAQEALNNVIKHANATFVEVSFNEFNDYQLIISDNGVGFDFDKALLGSGNGIYNMRERILSLNGRFNIETQAKKGTIIICTIPKGAP